MEGATKNLFGVIIKQNIKNGQSLSVTDLMKAYEAARFQYGWSNRQVEDIVKTKPFQERVYHLLNERGIIKMNIISFMQFIEKEGVIKTLKGLKVWKTTVRGENKSTYADPYIWVLLALELNPMIYADVVC